MDGKMDTLFILRGNCLCFSLSMFNPYVLTFLVCVCVCACVQVYHTLFWPLEFTVANRDNNKCYGKIICNKLDSVRQLLPPLICTGTFSRRTLCDRRPSPPCAGPNHRLPLPGSERRRGDAGLQRGHEMRRYQGAAGRHHRDPPDLRWGETPPCGCHVSASDLIALTSLADCSACKRVSCSQLWNSLPSDNCNIVEVQFTNK